MASYEQFAPFQNQLLFLLLLNAGPIPRPARNANLGAIVSFFVSSIPNKTMKFIIKTLTLCALPLCWWACSGDKAPQPNQPATTNTQPTETPSYGYKVGDQAEDFRLKDVGGSELSMSDFAQAKGFVLIFTCNHCPYSIAYEDRIIALDKAYKAKGFPVIAINPNDPALVPEDGFEAMQTRAREKNFTFPYLFDEGQKVFPKYGATKTPHCYIVEKTEGKLKIAYTGAFDDNKEADQVKEKYLEKAIEALLAGNRPNPDATKAFGCSVKYDKEKLKL